MGTGVVSATEAVRSFSELLNNIRFRGDRYTILRGGKPVAAMGPVASGPAVRTLGELPGLLAELPHLDSDDEAFAADVLAVVELQPGLPGAPPWE